MIYLTTLILMYTEWEKQDDSIQSGLYSPSYQRKKVEDVQSILVMRLTEFPEVSMRDVNAIL